MRGMEVCPKSEDMEADHVGREHVLALLSRATQECPNAGVLWAEAIFMEPKPKWKKKSICALKKCEHDPHIPLAISHLFWAVHKMWKAREWFTCTVKLIALINLYGLEQMHGSNEQLEDIKVRCIKAWRVATPKTSSTYWQEKFEFFLVMAASELKKLL